MHLWRVARSAGVHLCCCKGEKEGGEGSTQQTTGVTYGIWAHLPLLKLRRALSSILEKNLYRYIIMIC